MTQQTVRRLAAILAVDVVGYSRLMQENETHTVEELNLSRALIGKAVARNDGRLFGVAGDSLMAEFSSPVQAVSCALAIQSQRGEAGGGTGAAIMQFRIGVNIGDVIVEGDNLYGDAVNVAARLEALAESGHIYISAETHRLVHESLEAEFEDLGEQHLKNLADPVRVFRVGPAGTVSGLERRLAAVLVADMADYTRKMSADESGTHTLFKRHFEDVLHPAIAATGGHLVKKTGDGVMAAFPSVVNAVECAVLMQRKLRSAPPSADSAAQPAYRIAINIGNVIFEEDDIYGGDVNLAARLQPLADPGGIVVSEAAYRQIKRTAPVPFECMGEHVLKGIPAPVTVYRAILGAEGEARESHPAVPGGHAGMEGGPEPSAVLNKPGIVVLPFDNLGGAVEQEYFCDGLTNDLTTDLSRFNNLLVVSAHTAFAYKNKAASSAQVASELGVRYMVEGAVQRRAEHVRINVQLVDSRRDSHIWAERFDLPLSQLFEVQDEIVQGIIGVLAIRVDAEERARAMRQPTASLDAYDAYLKAMHFWMELQESEDSDALERCQRWAGIAKDLDPGYARALSLLGYTHVWAARQGWDDGSGFEVGGELIASAVKLDPYDYENFWDLAYYHLSIGDFDLAVAEYEKAARLNPNNPLLMVETAECLSYAGAHEEALPLIEKANQLNPHHDAYYRFTLAWVLYFLHRFDEGLAVLEAAEKRTHGIDLLSAATYAQLAARLVDEGDLPGADAQQSRAQSRIQEVLSRRPGWTVEAALSTVAFRRKDDQAHWAGGLRRAGLPET